MSAHTILSPSQLFSLLSPVNATASPIRATIPSLSSSISGLSLNLTRYSPNLYTSAARKLLTVVSGSKKAVSVLKGNSNVEGVVTLTQEDDDHGESSCCWTNSRTSLASLVAHFDPNGITHGSPEDEIRYAGDLGNLVANADGVAEATITDNQIAQIAPVAEIPLSGPNSVVGRPFVVHELEDDLGKGGHELSLTTGNAGGRLACGVVGLIPL